MLVEGEGVPGEPVVVWSADSAYAVVLEGRIVPGPPTWRPCARSDSRSTTRGGLPADGEVWLDELRLGAGLTDPGLAGQVTLDVRAGDFIPRPAFPTRIAARSSGA